MNSNKISVLIVDDEKNIRETIKILLEDNDYCVYVAKNGYEALDLLLCYNIGIMITDLNMPEMDGIELMNKALEIFPLLSVVFITAINDVKHAVEAMKKGAFDYIQKSFTNDEFLLIIEKAAERFNLIEENIKLKLILENNELDNEYVFSSNNMKLLLSMVERIAKSKVSVLLSGESGVGKEVFAKLIHKKSNRKNGPFITINCGAIPENLIESELFGHVKGAFTGAISNQVGKFEQANNGTIFLDEIGELPFKLQVKLLRVLQEMEIQRIGDNKVIKVDARVLAATNLNLKEEVEKGKFREDLYYRLDVVSIEIPPLRERKKDIPLLIEKFIDNISLDYGKNIKAVDFRALYDLINYNWPGNIRELKNTIERAIALASMDEEIITSRHLNINMTDDESSAVFIDRPLELRDYERIIIMKTIKQANGNKSKAAEILGIKRQTLYNKLKEYEIE
jgi:DNA-binding NtrC family response regulator